MSHVGDVGGSKQGWGAKPPVRLLDSSRAGCALKSKPCERGRTQVRPQAATRRLRSALRSLRFARLSWPRKPRAYPRFPSQHLNGKEGSTVRVRKRASPKPLQIAPFAWRLQPRVGPSSSFTKPTQAGLIHRPHWEGVSCSSPEARQAGALAAVSLAAEWPTRSSERSCS